MGGMQDRRICVVNRKCFGNSQQGLIRTASLLPGICSLQMLTKVDQWGLFLAGAVTFAVRAA